MAGRAPPSAGRESGIVIVSSAARVERNEFDGVSEQEGDRQQQSQVSPAGRGSLYSEWFDATRMHAVRPRRFGQKGPLLVTEISSHFWHRQ